MACGNCRDPKQNDSPVDKRGNSSPAMTGEAAMASAEREINNHAGDTIFNIPYKEYLKQRDIFRQRSRVASKEVASSYSKDYKRIQIQQLIDILNYEEVGRVSPEQAIAAIWEMSHSEEYQAIVDEFEGLRQEIDIRYDRMSKNKIVAPWKP